MSKALEVKFSREFEAECKRQQVWTFRIESSNTLPGLPDRIMILQGKVIFVELKMAWGKIEKSQYAIFRLLQSLKIPVYVLTKVSNGVMLNGTQAKPLDCVIRQIMEENE